MTQQKKNKRNKIIMKSGSVSFPRPNLPAPKPSKPSRFGQIAAGLGKAAQGLAKNPWPYLGALATKSGDSLIADTIPRFAQAYSRGGLPEVQKVLEKTWLKPASIESPPVVVATNAIFNSLTHGQKQKITQEIKTKVGEQGLDEARRRFPQLPPNPWGSLEWCLFLLDILYVLLLLYSIYLFINSFLEGVDEFNRAFNQRGEKTPNEFMLDYFFSNFYSCYPPLGFDLNQKEWVYNACYITDEVYLLGIDVNF